MGVGIEESITHLLEAGADVIGSNCGHGMATLIGVAQEFQRLTDAPLIIQPNAGIPSLENEGVVYPESPATFAAGVPALLDAGVAIIGGCCGSTPAHIRALSEAVRARSGAA
jgi:methionine synthase I (cobalamin-dependent)